MPHSQGERRRPMRVRRREVLKAAAVPIVAGAVASTRFAQGAHADEPVPITKGKESSMTSRPLMTVRIVAAPDTLKFGAVPHGTRIFVPVTGGDFESPRLRGRVLPGGGDWLLLRADGVVELDLRITLETDDHALIYMTFQGLRHGPSDVIAALGRREVVDPTRYYFRTVPRFETSVERYAFLNRIVTVGEGEARPDGAVHRIDEIL